MLTSTTSWICFACSDCCKALLPWFRHTARSYAQWQPAAHRQHWSLEPLDKAVLGKSPLGRPAAACECPGQKLSGFAFRVAHGEPRQASSGSGPVLPTSGPLQLVDHRWASWHCKFQAACDSFMCNRAIQDGPFKPSGRESLFLPEDTGLAVHSWWYTVLNTFQQATGSKHDWCPRIVGTLRLSVCLFEFG